MIRAVWRSLRMRPGPSLLLAVVVAAAVIVMAGTLAIAAAVPLGGRGGESSAAGQAEALARDGAHVLVLALSVLVGLALAAIVANALTTSLRRRAETLALLRALGASSSMLLFGVLAQALAIGLLGAAIGLLGSLGVSHLLADGLAARNLSPVSGDAAMPQVVAVGAALLATLIGALPPALHAAAAPPGTTTHPVPAPQRPPLARGVVSVLLIVLGTAGAAIAWRADDLPHRTGVLGAAAGTLLVGLLIGLPATTRPLIALLGLPASLTSSGRLALRHLAAAPRAAGAIATAPMLATAAACVCAPLTVSLRALPATGAPGRAAAVLDVMPALLIGEVVLAGICTAGSLAAAAVRTGESALMRAVGLSRRQRATQFLWESALAAAAGMVLGAAAGMLLAGATGAVLASQGLGALMIPWRQLLLLLATGCVVGVLATAVPALRASSAVTQDQTPA
ncbi:FtsX-like permease family protein [Actinomyces ruminicola]|uniref:FtsX-like permease family protein n=2 Tax=Actinomyces ruminicola TaxID=332524 RepID=A0A1H0B0Z6_9ACTO|nr:FtsX-like permease family protein [Actinomyces ruminicola]